MVVVLARAEGHLLPHRGGWLAAPAAATAAPGSAMTALLATEASTMRFGGVRAVDGVGLRRGEGELRCLIGPNGAGKSTFFKCLTGQLSRPAAASSGAAAT